MRNDDPAREAWALAIELGRRTRRRQACARDEIGLTPIQGHLLHLLDEEGPLRMSEVAQRLGCDASNVTGLVDRLETKGLVERRPYEHDRRVKLLAATPKGHELHKLFHERMEEPPEELTSLPLADQQALRDILRRAVSR
jgi:DNA-binding MarR family transcriptional regulator